MEGMKEGSAIKNARKTFANADACTVREMAALDKYFSTFTDGSAPEIEGEDMPHDPELTSYVNQFLGFELTDKHLTDEYLSDHMGEMFEYKRKLSKYGNLKEKYPKFFGSLPEEKRMMLKDAKASSPTKSCIMQVSAG